MRLRAALANVAWLAASSPAHHAFARALRNPRAAQESLLRRYLHENGATRFGSEHGFAAIRDYRDYAARVPARDYEAFRPWIAAIARGERGVLTQDAVRTMQPTGGSTGGRKWIPFTPRLQAEFARAVSAWITGMAREHPAILRGRAYWSVTPAAETPADPVMQLPAGFEDDSAYLGGAMAPLVAATMAVPGGLRRVRDIGEFRRLTLLHLLRAEDLGMISVWHPSFLGLLMDAMAEQWSGLLADLAKGVTTGEPALDVPASPRRAQALRATSPEEPADVWPHLALISCWGDAAAAGPMEQLQRRFHGVAFQRKGLIATEAIVSVPYGDRHPLAITSHLFEFARADGSVLPAWELEQGGDYSVMVTTGGGLYRYRLRDRVLVDGFLGRTPCIRFLGKEDRVSDQCGEKLEEAFVAAAVDRTFAACGVRADFAMLAPETRAPGVRYVLFLAPRGPVPAGLAVELESALGRNPQYAYAVRLGQLLPVTIDIVDGSAAGRYVERLRALGARLGDIKPAALSPLDDWREILGSRRVAGPREVGTGRPARP